MNEQDCNEHEIKFWKEMRHLYPEIVKAITSLSKKSYLSITNVRTGVTWWSKRAMDYFQMDENYTISGKEHSFRHVHPEDIIDFKEGFKERVAGKKLDTPWEYRISDGDSYHWFSAMARMLYDNEGNPSFIVIRYDNHGIPEEVDAVTGLHTAPAFNRTIAKLLSEGGSNAILKVGLDQFSHINVMYGATFSDQLLNRVAEKIIHYVHPFHAGYVYRLSGAKFAVTFEDITREQLSDISVKIADALANEIEVDGKRVPIKISAGALFTDHRMEGSNGVRSRLTYAMNHSRYAHHGELVIFNDEVCGNDEDQLELISVIHQCATNHFEGFRLFYQPIADTKTGEICGMEALLRWEMEPYGMVSPGIFIEWLEEDPCIYELGNWILETALRDVARIKTYIPKAFVNVNISAAQLERKEFRGAVLSILQKSQVSPDALCLELTERCRNLDVNFLKEEVAFFHDNGIKIALDDFGTGNSSLSLALELPFDELKIDMSFIKKYPQQATESSNGTVYCGLCKAHSYRNLHRGYRKSRGTGLHQQVWGNMASGLFLLQTCSNRGIRENDYYPYRFKE